jgi:pimeloyl-ACP methyl ester carboxylesterase
MVLIGAAGEGPLVVFIHGVPDFWYSWRHQMNGLKSDFHGLNNTWEWLDKDYTLVTIPDVGHWAHHHAPDLVTDTIKWWLI